MATAHRIARGGVLVLIAVVAALPGRESSGLKAVTVAGLASAQAPSLQRLQLRVVTLSYNPWLPSKGMSLFGFESDYDTVATAGKIRQDLIEANGGLVDIEIVDRIERAEFPPEEDGGRLDETEYLELRSRGEGYYQRYGVRVDIARMVRENGLDMRVRAGEVDEVWYFGSWTYSSLESYMGGPGAFPVNGGLFSANSGRAFVVMFMEDARGPGLHAIGHRVESTLDQAYGWIGDHQDTPWARFRRHPRLPADWMVGVPMGVGDIHNPPNSRNDYDYSNDEEVLSTADDWLNFPSLTGATTPISAKAWGGTDLGHERWWFRHLPKAPGLSPRADSMPNALRQNNWWKYIFDMSRYPELVGAEALPIAVIASPAQDGLFTSPVSFTGYGIDQSTPPGSARVTRLVWDFGDGSPPLSEVTHVTASDPSTVRHDFAQPGTYRVSLIAEDVRGRRSSPVSSEVRSITIPGASPSPLPSHSPSATSPIPSGTPTPTPGAPERTATAPAPRGQVHFPIALNAAWIDGPEMPMIKDGMALVPAGEFQMGASSGDPDGREHERPQRSVHLDAYWIDVTEVTNAMFERFVNQTGHTTTAERRGTSYAYSDACHGSDVSGADWRHPRGPGSDIGQASNHPVVHVSWSDAAAYCAWAGKRLPTEAEWEKAAGGEDGRKYPWGNTAAAGNLLNFADANLPCLSWADLSAQDGFALTAPVGHYPAGASSYGVLDMAGNVWEWAADWYDPTYYTRALHMNPGGPDQGDVRVLRGGAFTSLAVWDTRAASRNAAGPDSPSHTVGFRCAR